MAFRSSSRRQSSASQNARPAHPADSHAADLAQSLQNLSLATSPGGAPRSSRTTPLRNPSSSLASPGPAANSRFSPRSPSVGRESRSATPTLLRKSSTSSLRSVSTGPRQSLSRRASSANLSSSLPKSPLAMGEPVPEPKPAPTANSIAKDFFQADLEFQQGGGDRRPTEATVVLHDSCYGHRYSRPPASAEDLASIVERPERLKASTLGVALAYVRLGGRHADGEHDVNPRRDPTSIPYLPFRIRRSNRRMSLLAPPVVAVHGKDTMKELEAMCSSALSKLATNRIEVERTQKGKPELHSGDLYLGPHSLEAMEGALGAVCDAIDTVFTEGPRRSYVSIRPPGHHCSADYPSGFCWVNNVHVGIAYAMMNHGLTHAAIIDFDLHHGDGSQAITWTYNERQAYSKGRGSLSPWKKGSIGYYSLHDIQSYPCESGNLEKTVNASVCIEDAHAQNIWNVHLKPWANKAEFWELYETRYSVLLEKARSYLKMQSGRLLEAGKTPKSAIFISAGFDASEWESGGMQRHAASVPTDFYARITEDVVKMAADPDTGTDGRVISVMEGGYSDRAIYSGVCSHLSGLVSCPSSQQVETAVTGLDEASQDRARLGMEMGQRLGLTSERQPMGSYIERSSPSANMYDPAWWSGPELDNLEHALGIAPRPLKKPRASLPPTYSSPTHASTARAADPVKLHRSLVKNGQISRPPTPPPPEVPWTVAVQELRSLLVPDHRPTDSCTISEISEIVLRARQECRVTPPLRSPAESQAPTPTSGQRAGLRGRKPKVIEAISEENGVVKPRVKNASTLVRRFSQAADTGCTVPNIPQQHSSRGSSSEASAGVRRSSRRASTASVLTSIDDYAVPESNVSSRGSSRVSDGAPLQVKKSRPVPAPRKEPIARAQRDPVKKAPVRPGPPKRASTSAVTKGKPKINGSQRPATSGGPSENPSIKVSESDEGSGDVDFITSGMNKVRITLVNRSGRETDEGTQVAPEPAPATSNIPAPRPRIKIVSRNASPDRPQTSDAVQPAQPAQPEINDPPPYSSPIPSIATPVDASVSPTSPDPQSLPLPPSSPVQTTPKTPDMFVPYQPDGPTPAALPVNENVRFLPPNMATPTPMKRTDLPMFTPTSAIPFATREEGSGWESPESPSK